jgi:hypothetical protein
MVFGIDDSEIQIDGRPHTILAAIGVRDPSGIESALDTLKVDFGLSPTDEVKWNGMRLIPQRTREALSQELMVLLHKSVPLVVIHEGRDKQLAAERTAEQIVEFLKRHPYSLGEGEAVELIFDEGIIEDQEKYARRLQSLFPSPTTLAGARSVHSHDSVVIQLADVLAGFNRLATDIALGRSNKEILIQDDGLGRDIRIDLLNYISLSLRWAMWGEVPPPPDPNNVTFDATWPFKQVGGYGFRVHSGISQQTIERIYHSRVVYMGCLH